MIVCVKYENLDQYGKAFHSQFCLRHQCFIERQNYNVSKYNGMEFDQYDTPAAVYLVYLSPEKEALGCSRLTPVDRGSMLADLWPGLVDHPEEAFTPGAWEGTRFCIAKSLPMDVRQRICRELVIGYFEAGLDIGIKNIIGVMPPLILRTVFGGAGCQYDLLGKRMRIPSGEMIAAATMQITSDALHNVRKATGIFESVISEEKIEEYHNRKIA
ncbi:MAG: acyl-homoserine-lactone synthase [Alphaproteobacteria bacterium]